ncbi:MAG TPA: TerC/Alx family metal homeostasis membrane protein [Bacteroidales bacterium]|nr:TerC/Alx family metal homeostasis membrane protein [Bacteroidales bacterium]
MISQEVLYFGLFSVFVLGILFFDLTVVGRNSHVISFKESIIWTSVWVSFALLFYLFIVNYGDRLHGITDMDHLMALKAKYAPHLKLDPGSFENSIEIYRKNMGMEYLSGYLIEYTLSMDNVFVIMMILSSFSVREKYYKQVLFWGILGAIVLRFLFIFTGAALIQKFEWILLVFGAFLVYTGVKIFIERNKEEKIETKNHPLVKFFSRYANVYPRFFKDHFFVHTRKKVYITPLFIVLVLIEFTDVIFAMDSIPAIFAITRDPYLVFFSNIFAIIGLRSLFFLLMRVVNIFHYLKIGISFLLVFVGVKLLLHTPLEHMGFKPVYSLYVILLTLAVCIIASILFPEKKEVQPE